MHFLRVADEDEVGNVVGQHAVGSRQGALLLSFGEHDALLVTLCTRNDLFN